MAPLSQNGYLCLRSTDTMIRINLRQIELPWNRPLWRPSDRLRVLDCLPLPLACLSIRPAQESDKSCHQSTRQRIEPIRTQSGVGAVYHGLHPRRSIRTTTTMHYGLTLTRSVSWMVRTNPLQWDKSRVEFDRFLVQLEHEVRVMDEIAKGGCRCWLWERGRVSCLGGCQTERVINHEQGCRSQSCWRSKDSEAWNTNSRSWTGGIACDGSFLVERQ